MASWAAIPVLSGFRYDARTHRMDLLPRLKTAAFQCFWSTPGAWGSFSLTAHALTLTPVVGLVSLKQLTIPSSLNNSLRNLKVTSAGKEIAHTASPSDDGILLQFSSPLDVDSTRPLRVQS
jgi:hypothetical protein